MRFVFVSLWSLRLGFVAIAHPRDFVMSPKRYSLFPLPNERARVLLPFVFRGFTRCFRGKHPPRSCGGWGNEPKSA